MEDAPALIKYHGLSFYLCLNPCFNGRCTRTLESYDRVSLSVDVLILVLMEDAPAQLFRDMKLNNKFSLNPCFNGRCTRTKKIGSKIQKP